MSRYKAESRGWRGFSAKNAGKRIRYLRDELSTREDVKTYRIKIRPVGKPNKRPGDD